MSVFICPYCFAKVETDSVLFQCVNPNCLSPDAERSAFLADKTVDQLENDDVYPYQTVFSVPPVPPLFRFFGASNPVDAYCPQCDSRTSIRVCPECHSPLPHGVDSLSNLVVAVVGAKETGKSHYIAVLIQRIRSLFKDFHWTLSAVNDATMNIYRQHFYAPLFDSRKPRTLAVTQTARGNSIVKTPLSYSLSMIDKKRLKTVTLAFFDTAGEDMDDAVQMRVINRYIYNAAGIIVLVDPLQLPKVRSQIRADNLPQADNAYAGDVINRVSNLIRDGRGLSRQKKIPIPLAVAFSKIDMLKDIFGKSSTVFQESTHRGGFNLREFGDVNGSIQDWIEEYDEQRSLVQLTQEYENAAFFGISALGGNPDAEGFLPFFPRPIRVEDPFLWLLWKNHIIEGRVNGD